MEVSVASAPPRGWGSTQRLALARTGPGPEGPGRPYSEASPWVLHRLVPLHPERRPVSSWASLAPKSAVPAGQLGSPPAPSLSQGVGVDLFGPLPKEPPTGSPPKGCPRVRARRHRPGPTGRTRRCAAGCHKATLKESARRTLWLFPKEGLEGRPRRAPSARTRVRHPEGLRRLRWLGPSAEGPRHGQTRQRSSVGVRRYPKVPSSRHRSAVSRAFRRALWFLWRTRGTDPSSWAYCPDGACRSMLHTPRRVCSALLTEVRSARLHSSARCGPKPVVSLAATSRPSKLGLLGGPMKTEPCQDFTSKTASEDSFSR